MKSCLTNLANTFQVVLSSRQVFHLKCEGPEGIRGTVCHIIKITGIPRVPLVLYEK